MPILPAAGRHDLADDEWRVLEALLPPGEEAGPYAQVEQAAAQPHAGSVRFRDAAVSA